MSRKQIVAILMMSPFYFSMALAERRDAVDAVCRCLRGNPAAPRPERAWLPRSVHQLRASVPSSSERN
jgi:hypothetical protein